MPRTLPTDVFDEATPALRQFPGFDYPYPRVLDESDAENAEGRALELILLLPETPRRSQNA